MRIIRSRISIPYLLVGLGVCISIFGPSIKSNVAPRQFNPTVRSEISKLEIIQTAMLGPNVLQVIMKNGCSKDITAVVASIEDHKTTRRDYIYAEMEQDQKLSPGATDEFSYGIDSSEDENIVIKAVLFSDMTREGDFREIRNVLERRLGVRIQLARFNSHLESLSQVDSKRIKTEFQQLRQFAENLPIKTDSNSTARKPFGLAERGCGVTAPNSSLPLSIRPLPFLSNAKNASSELASVQENLYGLPVASGSNITPLLALVRLNPFPAMSTMIGVSYTHWQLLEIHHPPLGCRDMHYCSCKGGILKIKGMSYLVPHYTS